MPLHFDPGDAFQFDWSEDFAVLGGERTKLQMAHIKLSHSRAFLLRAPAFEAAIPMLSQLLKAELAEREVRSIAYHMRSASFPAYKDLSGFDFAASEINERGAALAAINPETIYGGGAEGYTDSPTLYDDCRRAPDSQWFASRHRRRRRLARTDRRWRYGSRSCACGQRCGDG